MNYPAACPTHGAFVHVAPIAEGPGTSPCPQCGQSGLLPISQRAGRVQQRQIRTVCSGDRGK